MKINLLFAASLIALTACSRPDHTEQVPDMVEAPIVEELRPAPEQVEIFEPVQVERPPGVVLRREYRKDGVAFITEERDFKTIEACEEHRAQHQITSSDIEIVELCQ